MRSAGGWRGKRTGPHAGARRDHEPRRTAARGRLALAGKKIVVTAGATREPIDPVRFISNHSSGKMGIAIAEPPGARGAELR